MALQGTVKVEVLVPPDGTVKETQLKGGHPVLPQAAV
jgi:outer membrane biosynthesis protein TonB